MSSLIDLGLKQGSIISFSSDCKKGTVAFPKVEGMIISGRVGHEKAKEVNQESLFLVLSQECSIENTQQKFIELAQLKEKKIVDEQKVEHFLLGKDYKKLLVKHQGRFFEIEESLLTKVKKKELVEHLQSNNLIVLDSPLNDKNKRILLQWRVLTYFRIPFPDKFNRALMNYFKESDYSFPEYLKQHSDYIHSVRIFVSPEDVENAEHYHFSITILLYELEDDDYPNGVPRQFQVDLDSKLLEMLDEFSKVPYLSCTQLDTFDHTEFQFPRNYTVDLSITIDEFTFANADTMREFNFEYLCY
ncbi:hypothetical protein [Vibrio splendidus]|uniref:hypothetical protein n=1 Tax=Vibrio splendidus TaxID=29497 RepID=UPI000C84C983|nr:hypothetical protein [Vibrio splendidus]PMG21486.1 hypothetical protein BCU95_17860 [Vibrio splendidus]